MQTVSIYPYDPSEVAAKAISEAFGGYIASITQQGRHTTRLGASIKINGRAYTINACVHYCAHAVDSAVYAEVEGITDVMMADEQGRQVEGLNAGLVSYKVASDFNPYTY